MSLSPRLRAVVETLPLAPGLRVLDLGCGPGAAAREVARLVAPGGHVLAVDRSERAAAQVRRTCAAEITAGLLSVRRVAAEDLALDGGEEPYDLAFAVRVGAVDGRHPYLADLVHARVAAALGGEAAFRLVGEVAVWLRPGAARPRHR